MKRFPRGLMATCCVPWDDRGRFDEATFRRGVRLTVRETPYVYVFGTAGEGYAVTDSQFDQITTAFVDEMRTAGAEPMIGVVHLSLATILERIARWRDADVRLFQVSLPSWGALSERELFDFFDQVCGRFPDCRFMHYNLMRTKRLVTGKEYGRIAKAHPNFVATKNTGDSLAHIRSLIDDAPELQHFLSESGYVYGSRFGECSLLCSFVTNWSKLRALFDAGIAGDIGELTSIQREIDVFLRILFESVPGDHIDGAYDKIFCKMHDPTFPLRLLPPYRGATGEEYDRFVATMRERLPEWVPSIA